MTRKFKTASRKLEAITLQTRVPPLYFIINKNPPQQNSITIHCDDKLEIKLL